MEQRSSPARSLPPRKTTTTPQLSCELCRKRKVKCDKLTPCTNCAASGTVCVPIYRTRLPRGRHATRPRRVSSPPPTSAPGDTDRMIQPTVPVNEDLQERIHRLEALIQGMSSHTHTRTPSATSREQVRYTPAISASRNADLGNDQSVQLSDTSTFQTAPNPNTSPILNSSIVSKRLMLQRPDQFWADLVDEVGLPNWTRKERMLTRTHADSRTPRCGRIIAGRRTRGPDPFLRLSQGRATQ